ncbi:MAG: hydantoinase B/oxoprolinase family protein [Opitutales bacterium]|nr:hydantoinase B/oxoprolinase family protein [Opitutales bacterium]
MSGDGRWRIAVDTGGPFTNCLGIASDGSFRRAKLLSSGRLVVNAPHIPVHLGATGTCVRALRAEFGEPEDGDVWVTNHPGFYGGSHLPDITAVAPVFYRRGRCFAYLSARAHHAEVGGRRPGSMPPEAVVLSEEGVLIAPRLLAHRGWLDLDGLEALLRSGPYPSRNPRENLQVHMTNTAITDPEILELRYPARLLRFALRRGSGVVGAHRGGDGLVREIEFLAPVEVSLVTQHRVEAPYGRNGGKAGA